MGTVVGLMRELNEKLGLTFLVVTHDPEVGSQGSRTIYLKDGQIVGGRVQESKGGRGGIGE